MNDPKKQLDQDLADQMRQIQRDSERAAQRHEQTGRYELPKITQEQYNRGERIHINQRKVYPVDE